MKWPWVWRARLEAAEALNAELCSAMGVEREAAEECVNVLRSALETERQSQRAAKERIADLERMLAEERALRRQAEETLRTELQAWSERALAFVKAQAGYETAYSQPVPEVLAAPPLPPAVVEAITARAEVGTPLYRQLVGEARKRLDLKVEAADVAALVMAGEEVAW